VVPGDISVRRPQQRRLQDRRTERQRRPCGRPALAIVPPDVAHDAGAEPGARPGALRLGSAGGYRGAYLDVSDQVA
jgi:hypothetical protein